MVNVGNNKIKIFIASSGQNEDLAIEIRTSLRRRGKGLYDVEVWSQNVFKASGTTIQTLIDEVKKCDFGIFVCAPDDTLKDGKNVVRDNVIFELGLFWGRLGLKRAFYIIPEHNSNLHLPTDLAGVTALTYDDSQNLDAAVSSACLKIHNRITSLGPINTDIAEPSEKSIEDFKSFTGIGDSGKYIVFAHCDDARKFEKEKVQSPGGTLHKQLGNIWEGDLYNIKKEEQVRDDDMFCDKTAIFVVDSPHYNSLAKQILNDYTAYLTGSLVDFVDESIKTNLREEEVHQHIRIPGIVWKSSKDEAPQYWHNKSFGKFTDYFLIMRLPKKVLRFTSSPNGFIWIIAGIHSKASYTGVQLFTPINYDHFIKQISEFYKLELPDFFEAVYEVPGDEHIVSNFRRLHLKHFRELKMKSSVSIVDDMPLCVPKFFKNKNNSDLHRIPIHTVHLDPIAACNFQCETCIEKPERDSESCLSLESILNILCDLKQAGCQNLSFYGGEPTLHPNFATILHAAGTMGFNLNIVTNGSFLDKEDIYNAILKHKQRLNIRVSLDGNNSLTHSINHGLNKGKDQFLEIKNSVNKLIQENVSVIISFLLHKNVIKELEDACKYWYSKKATLFYLRPVSKLNGKNPFVGYNHEQCGLILQLIDKYPSWLSMPTWFLQWLKCPGNIDCEKRYNRCFSAYYRFVISPHNKFDNDTITIGDRNIKLTDKAWISLCSYRRYGEHGCEYPNDFNLWIQKDRLALIEKINPAEICQDIICCRNSYNEIVQQSICS